MDAPEDLLPPDDPGRAWLAPEAAPPAPEGQPAPVAPPVAVEPLVDPGGAPSVPVPLRPLTMGDLLDGGFAVLRQAPRTVLALAAVFIVPVQLVVAFLDRGNLADLDRLVDDALSGPGAGSTASAGSSLGSVIGLVGGSMGQVLIAAGLARLVSAWYAGSEPTLGAVLRSVMRRSPALLVAWALIHLLEVAGLLTAGIVTVVVMAFYLVAAPAIAVEELGPFAGMARSARLAGRRFWFLLAFGVLSGLMAAVLSQVLALLPELLGLLIGPDHGWIVVGIGAIGGQMIATAVVAGATVLAYLDLRVRTEGLDLALAADRHLPR